MSDYKIILIVDDMVEELTLMRSMLENFFDVRLAKSAKLALAFLSTIKVDLILLDIEMPGMTGFEFLEQLSEKNSINKKTPVIFVTSHAEKDQISQALGFGAKGYLVKPVQAKMLHEKIKAIIGMPVSRTFTLQEKLKLLIAAISSGDSANAEVLTRELVLITSTQSDKIRLTMDNIAKMINALEYERCLIKAQEFLYDLSMEKIW